MHCFLLPKWVIRRIDKARRAFLWGSSTRPVNGISLCNWQQVCLTKEWGGMGVPDLYIRNVSLILRWWWKAYGHEGSLWTSSIIRIRWQGAYHEGPRIWAKTGSFFWSQLLGVKHWFNWSSAWVIGDGTCISFWFDNWNGETLAQQGTRLPQAAMSLREAADRFNLELEIDFSEAGDAIQWRWSSSRSYSAKSVYTVMMAAGKISWQFQQTWSYNIPPTVRIFCHLLLKSKILTRDVMLRRHFHCDSLCVMCDANNLETAVHLIFTCCYARRIWHKVSSLTGINLVQVRDSVQETWRASENLTRSSRASRKWPVLFSCVCWFIWKQRNLCIFENKRSEVDLVASWIVHEATLWEKHCGRGGI
ncbi:uncharacterized protein LOC144558530 [Carex rostrata]